MAGRIPQSFINGLLERVDIVEVLGRRVDLRKAGANHIGRCPFHNEKTPSFHVYQDGHYHCFGCGAHGTTLSFLMEQDGLNYPEAVEALAATIGVEVPRERGGRPRQGVDHGLYDVLEAAAAQFRRWLRSHPSQALATAYLKSRGLGGGVARDYGIGLAPAGWSNLKDALQNRYDEDRLVASGLLVRNETGRVYDRFRERIVFPIRNRQGRVVGFGGRTFGASESGQAKYINSPESDVFHKARELYGLYEARREQRPQSFLVVEGYMDVVALAEHGFGNAVATMGTAIGSAHFETLFRFASRVVCCFDGDAAGRAAAWKAVDAAFGVLSQGRELAFVFLPDGEDPDSLVQSRGAAHFRQLAEDALPVGQYFLDHLQEGVDLASVDGKARLVDLAMPFLERLPPGSLRSMLASEVAARGGTRADTLETRLGRRPGGESEAVWQRAPPQPATAAASGPAARLAERLLREVLRRPQRLAELPGAVREQLVEKADGLFGEVVRYLADHPEADAATLFGRFTGDPAYQGLARLAEQPETLTEAQLATEFTDGVARYVKVRAKAARLALLRSVDESQENWQRYLNEREQTAS